MPRAKPGGALPSASPRLELPTQPVPFESPCISLRIAPKFSREDFAGPLAEHESLLYEFADRLLAGLRRQHSDLWWDKEEYSTAVWRFLWRLEQTAALIVSLPDRDHPTPDLIVTSPYDLVLYWGLPLGIVRRLIEGPASPDTLHVVVVTFEAVSIREVGVDAEDFDDPQTRLRLYLTDEEEMVAPFGQAVRRIGPYLMTASALPRYLRVDITRAPRVALPQDQIDWLFAEYTPRLLRWLWTYFLPVDYAVKGMMDILGGSGANALHDAVGIIRLRRDFRMQPFVANRALLEVFTSEYRRIPEELAKPAPAGWLPVFVQMKNWAGIRWLPIAAGAQSEAPEPMTERRMARLRAVETPGARSPPPD